MKKEHLSRQTFRSLLSDCENILALERYDIFIVENTESKAIVLTIMPASLASRFRMYVAGQSEMELNCIEVPYSKDSGPTVTARLETLHGSLLLTVQGT